MDCNLPPEIEETQRRSAAFAADASEVHKMVLARRLMDEGTEFWSWG